MNTNRLKTIQQFARRRGDTVASLCMPTEVAGSETRKSPILFKNLVREINSKLEGVEDAEPLLSRIHKSCEPLIDDYDFWQHQSPGLAVFCEAGECQFVRLPFEPPAGAYVGKRFHVKPLLRLINQDQMFFVLALSVNRCQMFWGDRQGLEPIEVDGLPSSLQDALQLDTPEQSLQFHTQTGPGNGGRAAMFHGHGGSKDAPQAQADLYIDRVSHAIAEYLKDGGVSNDNRAPLVLATVEEHLAQFIHKNSYPGLLETDCVKGSPDELTAKELHKLAWPLVEKVVTDRTSKLLKGFGALLAQGKASTKLDEISAAIRRGQVATVFVADDKTLLGSVEPVSGEVDLSEGAKQGGDVLNDIAAEALLQGGEPYVMPGDSIPGESGAAATYRY